MLSLFNCLFSAAFLTGLLFAFSTFLNSWLLAMLVNDLFATNNRVALFRDGYFAAGVELNNGYMLAY